MKTNSLFFLLALLISGCTESIFDDPNAGEKPDGTTLKGRVFLENQKSFINTYVFLTGFNAGTRTDAEGYFSLQVPTLGTSTSSALSGSFKLFFFSSNYKLDSVDVIVVNGQIPFPQKDFDNNGNLKLDKKLYQIFQITARVTPKTIIIKDEIQGGDGSGGGSTISNNKDTVYASFTFRYVNVFTGTKLFLPFIDNENAELAFGYVIQKNNYSIERFFDRGLTVWKEVMGPLNTEKTYTIKFPIVSYVPGTPDTNILPGEYTIIPYFLVFQPGMPQTLLYSLNNHPFNFTPTDDFLKLPIVLELQESFEVKEKEN